jgi:transketolase
LLGRYQVVTGGASRAVDPAVSDWSALARLARREIVQAIVRAKGGHLGGPLSAVEVLLALYFHVLQVRPEQPDWPERDRFILSKGHSSIALYVILALRGYLPRSELSSFDGINSRLQGHPDMTALPGLDMSTGSLGLGFSAAVGIALGAKLAGRDFLTFVMIGDGECNEGAIWESAQIAHRYQLDNLVAIVDVNGLQQFGWRDEVADRRLPPYAGQQLADRWAAFGWRVFEVDGHDLPSVITVLQAARSARGTPGIVLAHTTKGKGVSFMEGNYLWHSRVPTAEELQLALTELAEPASED